MAGAFQTHRVDVGPLSARQQTLLREQSNHGELSAEPQRFPEFLPPPGLLPPYVYGPYGSSMQEQGTLGSLARFIDNPATRLGPSTLNNASMWLNAEGELDFVLYNFLWMCALNRVSVRVTSLYSLFMTLEAHPCK